MINPANLTPEQFYRLQSDTWVQGAEAENRRIVEAFESVCRCNGKQTPGYYCEADWAILVIKKIRSDAPEYKEPSPDVAL